MAGEREAGGKKRASPEFLHGMAVGAALGLTVVTALISHDRIDRWMDDRYPVPAWTSIAFSAAIVVGGLVWGAIRRDRIMAGLAVALVPLLVGSNAVRVIDPNPVWAEFLRAFGMALMISVLLCIALVLGRRQRELERLVFSEATGISFFVTAVGTAVYGVAEGLFDAPRVSLVWVPVFAVISWLIALAFVERRYS